MAGLSGFAFDVRDLKYVVQFYEGVRPRWSPLEVTVDAFRSAITLPSLHLFGIVDHAGSPKIGFQLIERNPSVDVRGFPGTPLHRGLDFAVLDERLDLAEA